ADSVDVIANRVPAIRADSGDALPAFSGVRRLPDIVSAVQDVVAVLRINREGRVKVLLTLVGDEARCLGVPGPLPVVVGAEEEIRTSSTIDWDLVVHAAGVLFAYSETDESGVAFVD